MDVARAEHVSLQSKALEETTILLTCFQDQTERERQRASERESERERERESSNLYYENMEILSNRRVAASAC